ncbi:forkhead box protein O1 isoform X2 [Drosophila eugracilis]|nr:forkhead box protein O1 isoform X2 [Drosophila eugracilis]
MTDLRTSLLKSEAQKQSYTEENISIQETEDSDEERELTNLNWLLINQNLTWPRTNVTNFEENANTNSDTTFPYNQYIHGNQIKLKCSSGPKSEIMKAQKSIPKRATPSERFELFVNKVKRDLKEYEKFAAKYETDVTVKPPFNYSHIIGMAMLKNGRITLQQLCNWIEAKFAFFRVRKKWNNSIRHNLSLHHCFRNRKREEKGKGGYWELGVDLKQCDRKRIRNRKLCHPKLNQTAKYRYDQLTYKHNETSSQPQYSRLPKITKKNTPLDISKTKNFKKITTFTEFNFLESINNGSTDHVNEVELEKRQSQTISKESISQKMLDLDTLIIGPEEFIKAPQSFTSHKVDNANMVSGEEVFGTFDNINIYSDETSMFASNAGIAEDRHLSGPTHPCNVTINYDYTNFLPLADTISQQIHFMNNAENSRNDDEMYNLFDVCVTHY